MESDISNGYPFIPNLYYDFIARITSGIVFLIVLILLSFKYGILKTDAIPVDLYKPIPVILCLLPLSYVIGFLSENLSRYIRDLFNYSFNPVTDSQYENFQRTGKQKFVFVIEMVLGFPFNLSLLFNQNRDKSFSDEFLKTLEKSYKKTIPDLDSKKWAHPLLMTIHIRMRDKYLGDLLNKMYAETVLLRNLSILFFILMIFSAYNSNYSDVLFEWIGFALSTAAYSYLRRISIKKAFNIFVMLANKEEGNSISSS